MRTAHLRASCALALAIAVTNAAALADPVPIIVDTDIFSDVDDVGALAVLNAMADTGEAQILGVVVSTASKWGAPCVDVIDTYYHRPNVPIGTIKPNDNSTGSYQQQLVQSFPTALQDGNNAPDATTVYRQVLAAQPDGSVVIVSIGYLSNLAALLASTADSISPLDGQSLVAQKVKLLVVMGGSYPSGAEFNFQGFPSATMSVINNWPTRAVFDGAEVGGSIITGEMLNSQGPPNDPVTIAYMLYDAGPNGRPSWDVTAVLYAVRGDGTLFSEGGQGGHNEVASDGSNQWVNTPGPAAQTYLVKAATDDTIAGVLNDLMLQPPLVVSDAGTDASVDVAGGPDSTADGAATSQADSVSPDSGSSGRDTFSDDSGSGTRGSGNGCACRAGRRADSGAGSMALVTLALFLVARRRRREWVRPTVRC